MSVISMPDYDFIYDDDDCLRCEWTYDRAAGTRFLSDQCDYCAAQKPDPWAKEKRALHSFFVGFNCEAHIPTRVSILERMFAYVLTIRPFVDAHPLFRAAVVAKVDDLRSVFSNQETLDRVLALSS